MGFIQLLIGAWPQTALPHVQGESFWWCHILGGSSCLWLSRRPSPQNLTLQACAIDLNVCWHLVRQVIKPEGLQLTAVHPEE